MTDSPIPTVPIGAVDGGSDALRGYLARPAGAGPWPGVVAVHELFGLDANLRRQADRLAGAGYLTLGPDLFSDGGFRRCVVKVFRAMLAGRGPAVADLDAARSFLADHPDCDGRVGVIGFCMGGAFALVMAPRGFDVASVNYGKLPKDPMTALQGSCPIVGSYGGKDVSLRGAAATLHTTLDQLGIENDVTEYPSAGHAFLDDEYFGPAPTHAVQRVLHVGPDPLAAPQAWERIETFFAAHLQAGDASA